MAPFGLRVGRWFRRASLLVGVHDGLMLGRRRRRRAKIEQISDEIWPGVTIQSFMTLA